MTPKERVLAFYRHEMTDELPTNAGIHYIPDPSGFEERPAFIQTGKDWFGVDWIRDDSLNATTPDHSKPPIMEDICDWREVVKFPNLDEWDWNKVEERDHVSEIDRENKALMVYVLNGPFERLHMLMGFENALCALLTDPEEVESFFDAFMEWKCKLIEKVHEYYQPDVIMFHDDWGTQNNMFFSPDTWRELIKPQIKKAVDKTHELGMFFEFHSCGFIEQVVPEFVELGIDSWQGQEINDIPKLKELTQGKLGFHTTPKYQDFQAATVAGTLTEADVRDRIRADVTKHAEGGNYMPFILPWGDWWVPVMVDEVEKCAKEVYKVK